MKKQKGNPLNPDHEEGEFKPKREPERNRIARRKKKKRQKKKRKKKENRTNDTVFTPGLAGARIL